MSLFLGIETTCDETSAAVVKDGRIVLSNIVASQAELHEKYGGVVPEVASRKHFEVLLPVVEEALEEAKIGIEDIDGIAVAKEPGLPPALSVGCAYSSGLAKGNDLPLIKVNHLEAHISAIWLARDKDELKEIPYPYLCLLASGGHTELRLVTDEKTQKVIGKTLDDAAGEAFDKVARILKLKGYPGGKIIDEMSELGDETRYDFPRPMIDSENYDFSFSGLKTAVQRELKEGKSDHDIEGIKDENVKKEVMKHQKRDFAASFQEAVIDVLVSKTVSAAVDLGVDAIAIAGGVSANSRLRDKMGRECHHRGMKLHYPELEFCIDNAAMVAARGSEI